MLGGEFSRAGVEAGGPLEGAVSAAEKILNSHTMQALELFDPNTYLDLMYESQTGYSFWDSEEARWLKWCGANPEICA